MLDDVRAVMLSKYGNDLPFSEIGLNAQEALKARSVLARDRKKELYSSVRELIPQTKFQPSNLQKKAKEILERSKNLPEVALDSKDRVWLKWAAREQDIPKDLAKSLEKVPDKVRNQILSDMGDETNIKHDWATLDEFSRNAEDIIRQEEPMGYTGMKGSLSARGKMWGELKDAVQKDMREFVEAEGGEACKEWK